MKILFVIAALLAASTPLSAEEFPVDEAWAGEIVGQSAADILTVAKEPGIRENSKVREMRKLLAPNWPIEMSESSHPKGTQPGTGVLRTELKPGVVDLEPIEVDRTNKADRESQRKTELEGYSFACKKDACDKKDPISFRVVPFDSPRAIKGSLK